MNPLADYQKLPPFNDMTAIIDSEKFIECPPNWSVVISDVKGSTLAVKAGRFREVNIAGASLIALLCDKLKTRDFPFVFGGDGATILLPQILIEKFKDDLCYLIDKIEKDFDLTLRLGIVPYSEILASGTRIFMGKLKLSEGSHLAQLTGQGLALAEKMIKTQDRYLLRGIESERAHLLPKLSCRFAPMKSKNGQIITVTIAPVVSFDDLRLTALLQKIKPYLADEKHRPVHDDIRMDSFSQVFRREKQINGFRWGAFFELFILSCIQFLMKFFKLGALGQTVRDYFAEVPVNSDYQKYDGWLRAVLDCSAQDAENLNQLMHVAEEEGLIKYGMHSSDSAVATCVVDDIKNHQHIHFIDGSGGGYTEAASHLKSKLSCKTLKILS